MVGVTKTLDRVSWAIVRLAIAAGWIFLLPMIVLRVVDIVGKQVVAMPSDLVQAVEWDGFYIMVFLILGFGYLSDSHARIDVFRSRFTPRARAWIEIGGVCLALLPFSGLMVVYGIDYVATAYGDHDTWWVPHLDRWAKKAFLPLGFALLFAAGLVVLARNLLFLAGIGDAPAPSGAADGADRRP